MIFFLYKIYLLICLVFTLITLELVERVGLLIGGNSSLNLDKHLVILNSILF